MTAFWKNIKRFYNDVWSESPWLKSAGIVATAVTVLGYINTELPEGVRILLSEGRTGDIALVIIVLVYFFLVAVFSSDRLRFERKLRNLEQNFRYDKRGTLYNGNQPNIAFRIRTFKSILGGLALEVGEETLAESLAKTGRASSHDFATNLPSIFNQDVAKRGGGRQWDDLSFSEKVHAWADYDSSTGWGIVTGDVKGSRVLITITHLQDLFTGNGGLMFAEFLSGYCENVIAMVASDHQGGRYDDYQGAEFLELSQISDKTITIEVALR